MSSARQPNMIILAGPNGSGKTTFATLLSQHDWGKGCISINADDLAQKLGNWNDPICTAQAQQLAREQLEQSLRQKQNIIYETVFSHPSKLELIREALEIGYFVRLFFICTQSPRINIDRVAERFAKGGHTVPGNKISERYNRALLYGAEAMHLVHRGYLYDNTAHSTECESPYKLIFRTINGHDYKLYMAEHELPQTYAYFLHDFLAIK